MFICSEVKLNKNFATINSECVLHQTNLRGIGEYYSPRNLLQPPDMLQLNMFLAHLKSAIPCGGEHI